MPIKGYLAPLTVMIIIPMEAAKQAAHARFSMMEILAYPEGSIMQVLQAQ
jgi:hypothetical protein